LLPVDKNPEPKKSEEPNPKPKPNEVKPPESRRPVTYDFSENGDDVIKL